MNKPTFDDKYVKVFTETATGEMVLAHNEAEAWKLLAKRRSNYSITRQVIPPVQSRTTRPERSTTSSGRVRSAEAEFDLRKRGI